jgi:hypothetical protein
MLFPSSVLFYEFERPTGLTFIAVSFIVALHDFCVQLIITDTLKVEPVE